MSESRKKSRGVGFPATNRFVTIIAGFLDLPCLRSKSWPTVNLHFDPVRLSLVIPTLDQSGAEKQLTLLALNLPPERYRVEVIALNRGGYYEEPLRAAGIPVHILGKRFRIDPVAHYRLGRVLKNSQPQIVHAWLFAANSHVRLLKSSRSAWKCVVSERCVDTWKAGWQLALDRRLIPRTDAMVANSRSVAEFYRGVGVPDELLHVIPNGVEIPAVADRTSTGYAQERQAWLQRWNFPADAFVIGFTGRLAAQKKVDTLLWALHMLMLIHPRVRALFVGTVPEAEALRELARNFDVCRHVCFAGHQADATEYHRYWDAFWLASDFEGQSNSLLEALAAGLPVVASDIAPNRELIQPGVTGLLATPGETADFALQMRKIIEQPEWAAALGDQARRRMQHDFSVSRMVQQHDQLYQNLLKAPPSEGLMQVHGEPSCAD